MNKILSYVVPILPFVVAAMTTYFLVIEYQSRKLRKQLERKIAYHLKCIQLINEGRIAEVPPFGTHPDELIER